MIAPLTARGDYLYSWRFNQRYRIAANIQKFVVLRDDLGSSCWNKLVILVVLSALLSVAPAFAAQARLEKTKVTVAYTSLAGGFAALWLANEKGFFKEYGLDVELVYTSMVAGVQAVVAGNAQFTGAGCYNVMLARRGGADVVLIANLRSYNPYILVTRSDLVSIRQLVKKRIAINRLGDSTHFSALGAVRELGIDPASITFVQVGSTAERLIALQTGLVEASLLGVSALERSKELGFNTIFNFHDRKVPGCDGGPMAVSESFRKNNSVATEAFLRGYFKGNAYFHEGSVLDVLGIMAKYMRGTVTETRITGAYESLRQRTSKQPDSMREAVASILEWGSAVDKAWSKWRPEQFYDPSIVAKLKGEGFLEREYEEVRFKK